MSILDFVFPKTCLGCGRSGSYICSSCLSQNRTAQPICPYCERASIDGFTHVRCQKKFGLDGLISIWEYEGVIRKAILALKYKYATEITQLLKELVVNSFKSPDSRFLIPDSVALVPVPLHWHRQNVRGFNQSEEIGKGVAREMGWEFNPELLIKTRQTYSQAGLPVKERKQNLKGVFALDSRFQIPDSIILFDDVFTTGSTLKEAAKMLKRAGVDRVWGLTIAR